MTISEKHIDYIGCTLLVILIIYLSIMVFSMWWGCIGKDILCPIFFQTLKYNTLQIIAIIVALFGVARYRMKYAKPSKPVVIPDKPKGLSNREFLFLLLKSLVTVNEDFFYDTDKVPKKFKEEVTRIKYKLSRPKDFFLGLFILGVFSSLILFLCSLLLISLKITASPYQPLTLSIVIALMISILALYMWLLFLILDYLFILPRPLRIGLTLERILSEREKIGEEVPPEYKKSRILDPLFDYLTNLLESEYNSRRFSRPSRLDREIDRQIDKKIQQLRKLCDADGGVRLVMENSLLSELEKIKPILNKLASIFQNNTYTKILDLPDSLSTTICETNIYKKIFPKGIEEKGILTSMKRLGGCVIAVISPLIISSPRWLQEAGKWSLLLLSGISSVHLSIQVTLGSCVLGSTCDIVHTFSNEIVTTSVLLALLILSQLSAKIMRWAED